MDLHMHDQDGVGPYAAAAPDSKLGPSAHPQAAQQEHTADGLGQSQQQQSQPGDEQQAAPQLTPTVSAGLQDIETRRQQLHGMIDELAQVGLTFLDTQRQRFVAILDSFKEEIDRFCQEEAAKGHQVSFDTTAAHERLGRAQQLVQCLGGAVCQPGLPVDQMP